MKVDTNTANYWAGTTNERYGVWEPAKWGPGRNDFLFTAGAIAVIGGLLFPLSARILDILLIFSICLTVAALMVTFSVRSALQVQGFPSLIVLATMLHITLGVALAKLLIFNSSADTIFSLFGAIFIGDNCLLTILIFGILATIIFGAVCKAVRGIIRTATKFTSDIVPVKQISLNSDLKAGVINESQALELRGKIVRETGFFVAMTGAARFILCGAVIEFLIIFVNFASSLVAETVALTTAGISAKMYTTSSIGAGAMLQISALLAAVGCRYLVRRSSVYSITDYGMSEQEFTKRFELIKNPSTRFNIAPNQIVVAEWFDESQCTASESKENDLNLWICEKIKDNDYYQAIAELIESKPTDKTKTILMAAQNAKELGVTVPVNIAIHLAQKNEKCLLIDLDWERNAISKVFDIDIDCSQGSPEVREGACATCISNLWIWPASKSTGIRQDVGRPDAMNIKKLITSFENKYDRLIIYAPNVGSPASVDWDKIAGCIRAAMLFGREDNSTNNSCISDLYNLLACHGCEILRPTEVFAEAS